MPHPIPRSIDNQQTRTVVGEDGASLWTTRAVSDDEPMPWRWLVLLSLLALVLRAIGLNSGLWYDEIVSLTQSIRLPLYSIVTEFPSNNQHTLFSVLAHISTTLLGEQPWTVRLPSLIFGVAAVPVLYLLAREFVTRREALLASVLMATAYHPVWFSQNARGYSALAFLTLLSSWLFMRGLRRGRFIDAVWYGLAGALGTYAHLTMMFLVVSHAVLCGATVLMAGRDDLVRRRGRFAVLAFGLAALFSLLLYSPLLFDVKDYFVQNPNRSTPATPVWAAGELVRGLRVGLGAGVGALVALIFLATGLLSYVRQSRFVAGLFVLPGLVTVGVTLALGRPIFPRFIYFLVGIGLLIAVRGALEVGQWIGRGRTEIGPVLVFGMAALSLVALVPNYRYPKQDFDGALRFVEAKRVQGEAIVTVGLTTRIYREFYQRPFQTVSTPEEFRHIRAGGQPVWVLYTLEQYIEARSPELMQVLRSDCVPEAVFRGTVGKGDVTVCRTHPIE